MALAGQLFFIRESILRCFQAFGNGNGPRQFSIKTSKSINEALCVPSQLPGPSQRAVNTLKVKTLSAIGPCLRKDNIVEQNASVLWNNYPVAFRFANRCLGVLFKGEVVANSNLYKPIPEFC
jgi:hypothetical protein